ncbi:hypothetical protein IWW37_004833 [Coemansia sp. RSA 2050]|nr:hypothetical protein IWW37_004833 [Coemansia sp. RSA 2050]
MSADQYAYTTGPPPLDALGAGGRHQAHTHVQYPAAGMSTAPQQQQQRRRLSNAPSDGTAEGRSHAGPAAARRTAAHADYDATSEDEIESLKRDMSSDLWALQRQRMRREQLNNRQRPPGSTTESPSSPRTQDTSPVTRGKATALSHYQKPAGLALHRQEISPPPPLAPPHLPEPAGQPGWPAYPEASSGPIEPAVPSSPHGYSAYVYPATGSPQQPYTQVVYAHQPHYAHHQQHHFQPSPPHQLHAQTAQAYSATVAAAAAYAAQAPALAYVHGRQLTTAPPLPPIVDSTSVSRDYSVPPPGYAIDAPHYFPKLWPSAGGYPIAATNVDNSGRYESASVQSNDQISVSLTDASGYSQQQQQQLRSQHVTNPFANAIAAAALSQGYTGGSSASTDHHGRPPPEQVGTYPTQHQPRYPRHQQQSPPPMATAHSPLHQAAGSPPMEQKRIHTHVVAAETGLPVAAYSGSGTSVARAADHVTDMGIMPAYHAYTSRAQQQHHQPLPVAAARVSPPMQEMQEHNSTLADPTTLAALGRLSPLAPYPALSGPAIGAGAKAASAIAIQSLLNSPLEDTFAGVAGDTDRCSSADSGSEAAAIHEHIAKENARFRQHSSVSGQLPIPPHIAPSAPTAHQHNSSPNSRSSYHSAGYSVWHGRAETVNLDFATAQQSLSSTDDPNAAGGGLGLSMANEIQRQHPVHLPNAPLPTIPASFTYAANTAATAFAASVIASLPPPNHADDYQYRYYKRDNKRDSKPISVLVQVSDGSREGSVNGAEDDDAPALPLPDSDDQLQLEVHEPSCPPLPGPTVEGAENDVLAGDVIVKMPLSRKGTSESLDNVLEYYRTHSSEVLDKRASSTELAPLLSEAETQQHHQQLESSVDDDALFALPSHGMPHQANMTSKADFSAARSDSLFDAGFQSPLSLTGGSHMAAVVVAAVESASSDPVQKRQLQQHRCDGWPESHYSSPSTVKPPAESSVFGTRPHTREQTPEAGSSERASSYDSPPSQAIVEMHDNEQLLSARHWHIDVGDSYMADMDMYGPHAAPNPWQQRPVPLMYHHSDVYDALDQLPEPETLELPPTTAAEVAHGVVDDDGECVVQMEMIDGISELSDMLDMSMTHDSDYGYSNSNSSTDSFGEPIEHETGILAKSLGPQMQNIAALTDMSESVSRLADGFSRTALAPVMVIHQLSTQHGPQTPMHSYFSRVAPPPGTINGQRLSALASNPPDGPTAQRLEELGGEGNRDMMPDSYSSLAQEMGSVSAEALHSGRTNASTLTTSTSPEEHTPITAVPAAAGNKAHGAVALVSAIGTSTVPTAVSATTDIVQTVSAAVTVANNLPLEIVELAGELEISLAREQEDYYSENVSQANLDPMILQNLGKAVHQQCLLQRQHLQRRKSNMHLGLAAGGGNSSSDEHGIAPVADAPYDDYELALKAMLLEVSHYFVQSGLNQVFPFSAKWVDWLTRHPDRPFPWRKDPEDDDETNRDSSNNGGRGGRDGYDDDSDSRSDASSFGEEPPTLSRPLPPEDVLSKATIPMSMRRPVLVKDFVSQEKRKGINAHWQYYSVINQITVVASGIHRRLVAEGAEADHSSVAHQLAALYQFLGGDFKKFKPDIESIFETIKQSLCTKSTAAPAGKPDVESVRAGEGELDASEAGAGQLAPPQPRVLDAKCVSVLREMMASIIAEALYSTSKVAAVGVREHPPPNTPTTGIRANKQSAAAGQTQTQQTAVDGPILVREAGYAISTLKGLPTQPIVRYLAKEMRVANGERRRRGLAHNLSRNNSMGHMRHHHHQFPYQTQQQPPLPPLPPMPAVAPAAAAVLHNHNAYHSGSSASSANPAPAAAGAVHDGVAFEQNRERRSNSHWQAPMLKQETAVLQTILSADEALVQQTPLATTMAASADLS